jgi:hypothetical protein
MQCLTCHCWGRKREMGEGFLEREAFNLEREDLSIYIPNNININKRE